MKNIMVDLETWGVKPYSTIISIGAVYFDPSLNDPIRNEFHITIDPIASEAAGFRKDADTLCWWLQPERNAAWKEWYETVHFEPQTAFFGFGQWLHGLFDINQDPRAHADLHDVGERETFDPADHILMWGNGAGFDNVLLRQGYELLKLDPPWRQWNDRCFRTMKALPGAVALKPPYDGLQHNALVDARQQALWLCEIINGRGLFGRDFMVRGQS